MPAQAGGATKGLLWRLYLVVFTLVGSHSRAAALWRAGRRFGDTGSAGNLSRRPESRGNAGRGTGTDRPGRVCPRSARLPPAPDPVTARHALTGSSRSPKIGRAHV